MLYNEEEINESKVIAEMVGLRLRDEIVGGYKVFYLVKPLKPFGGDLPWGYAIHPQYKTAREQGYASPVTLTNTSSLSSVVAYLCTLYEQGGKQQ